MLHCEFLFYPPYIIHHTLMLCKSKLNNEDKYESKSKFYIFSLR